MNKIIQGDCLEKLKELADNSVDAVVTDPPYGLSFMGKKWDYDVPSVEIWQECLRVLKPGGYLLAFAGTRTQHRMAVRIEDAGFEIRDMIAWVYGSGFPKSLNIGKAVDKLQGNKREVVGKTQSVQFQEKGYEYKGNAKGSGFANEKYWGFGNNITKGSSEWEGWGTALKPALEPITVARKPLSEKNVAENVLKWGTGGINIDGSRVEAEGKDLERLNSEWDREWNTSYSDYADKVGGNAGFNMNKSKKENAGLSGRFPANLIHDGSEEVVDLFPNSKSTQGKNVARKDTENVAMSGKNYARFNEVEGYNDSGSAARFFYCAKASKSERNKGCEGLEEKLLARSGGAQGAENNGEEEYLQDHIGLNRITKMKNNHPTVKPIALMEYLVNLVSRENAVVLDPFAGSGSTLIACKKLGRQYIGIELDPEYCKIAEARLNAY